MKHVLALILSVACALHAPGAILINPYRFGGAAPEAPTYLRMQDFEGAGYDNSETWTTSLGSPNADYTTTVLAGSHSLFLGTASAATRVRSDFTNTGEIWIYAMVHLVGSAPAGDRMLIGISANGSGSTDSNVSLTSAAKLRVACGGANAVTVDSLSFGTTYHVWLHYAKGTGANAVLDVGFSADTTRPTSGNKFIQLTTGTITNDAGRIWLGHTATTASDQIWDKVRVDDVVIGDNPT